MTVATPVWSAVLLMFLVPCANSFQAAGAAAELGRSASEAHCRGQLLEAQSKLRVHESCCSQLDALRMDTGAGAASSETSTSGAAGAVHEFNASDVWQGGARARIAALTAELLAQERALAEARASQGDMNQRLVRCVNLQAGVHRQSWRRNSPLACVMFTESSRRVLKQSSG